MMRVGHDILAEAFGLFYDVRPIYFTSNALLFLRKQEEYRYSY
jgi:hypothetical protein